MSETPVVPGNPFCWCDLDDGQRCPLHGDIDRATSRALYALCQRLGPHYPAFPWGLIRRAARLLAARDAATGLTESV